MSLTRARNDWLRFSSGGGFETDITVTPPGGSPVTVQGIAMKHHLSIDTDGANTNSMNAHATIAEKLLIDESYPVRNAEGVVAMYNHLLRYTDSTGVEKEYAIQQVFPDETVGVITFILGNYGSA